MDKVSQLLSDKARIRILVPFSTLASMPRGFLVVRIRESKHYFSVLASKPSSSQSHDHTKQMINFLHRKNQDKR